MFHNNMHNKGSTRHVIPNLPPGNLEQQEYYLLSFVAASLFILGFAFNSPREILFGTIKILTSPANLITDYFALANVGSALVNASLMIAKSLILIKISRAKIDGSLLAAILTLAGFSFFGKNLYNSFPIILGVFLYAKITHVSLKNYLTTALFGTALSPLVSEISFHFGLPTFLGIICGVSVGLFVGFILPPLANHFTHFHKGYTLYNIGFTAGVIGTMVVAVMKSFGVSISLVNLESSGNNVAFSFILYGFSTYLLLCGITLNGLSLRGYGELLKESGKAGSDYLSQYGFGLSLINMGFLGILSTSYVLFAGGELNGPIVGGLFTIIGFGAYGKHPKNTFPIFIGVFLVCHFYLHDTSSTAALLSALFGTALAPISGFYGPLYGVLAGGLQLALMSSISYLHEGVNLYNGGFASGIIAATITPLIGEHQMIKQRFRKKFNDSE